MCNVLQALMSSCTEVIAPTVKGTRYKGCDVHSICFTTIMFLFSIMRLFEKESTFWL